jgi:hypothetical protein
MGKTNIKSVKQNTNEAKDVGKLRHEKALSAKRLRRLVVAELEGLGLSFQGKSLQPSKNTKEFTQQLHNPAREIILWNASAWIAHAWEKYQKFFACGKDINPKSISPRLIEVITNDQKELFRLARYTWSLPYTKGYGRRLQYLLIDDSNNKLIGILGLQSPPLSFPGRDKLFSYPDGKKIELVNQTMDIYTLGAIPPYSRLLGGKLVALASASNEIRLAYKRKYSDHLTLMEERKLPARLVALTTTSAYGRSSIYNRLRYNDIVTFQSLGYTEGYGAFHLERLYPKFRAFLEAQEISTIGGFGKGPRIKWQTMVRALEKIGFNSSLLRHGVKREIFLVPLIRNLKNYMEGVEKRPHYIDVTFDELANYWRDRWLIPRSERVDGWCNWNPNKLESLLLLDDKLTD